MRLDRPFTLYASQETRDLLYRAAKVNGLSMADYIRRSLAQTLHQDGYPVLAELADYEILKDRDHDDERSLT